MDRKTQSFRRENWRCQVLKKTASAEAVLGDPAQYFFFVCIDKILETLAFTVRITLSGSFLELKLHILSKAFIQDMQHQCLSDLLNHL